MAVPKFYRVLRGQRGQAARTAYLNYLETLGTDRAPVSRGNRPTSMPLYVLPFGIDLGTELVLETSALQASHAALNAGVGGNRVLESVPAGKAPIKIRTAKAARVSATSGLSGTGTNERSKLTGLYYKDYGGQSFSCPFGRNTAAEKEGEAFAAIKAALGNTYRRIHLIEERI
jgi:hypothetical protein